MTKPFFLSSLHQSWAIEGQPCMGLNMAQTPSGLITPKG